MEPLVHVAGHYAWFQWTVSHGDLVITQVVGYHHLTGEYIPLEKASAIGGPVVAVCASSGDILVGNVQRESPQLVQICRSRP